MPGLKLSTPATTIDFDATKAFVAAPADVHLGICVQVIDLGRHGSAFRDPKTGAVITKHESRLGFELPFAKMQDGRPFLVSQKYNNISLHPKAGFRKVLELWRGKAFSTTEVETFDLKSLLGVSAMVSVVHTPRKEGEGVWVNINGLTRVGRNPETGQPIKIPDAVNPLVFLELTKERFDRDVFESLSPKTKEHIMQAREWTSLGGSAPRHPLPPSPNEPPALDSPWPDDSDIPF